MEDFPEKEGEKPTPDSKRFRQWPKKMGLSGQLEYDKEKIREIYLSNPEYEFKKFCNLYGFNYSPSTVNAFPLKAWQAEFINRQTAIQDDEVIGDALKVRKRILWSRVRAVETWGVMASNMKLVMNQMISGLALAAQHDQRNSALIIRGEIEPKLNTKPSDMFAIASAMKILQEVESRALLVPLNDNQKQMLPIPERTASENEMDAEEERINNMQFSVKGWSQSLSSDQITGMLAGWFDQAQNIADTLEEASPPEDLKPAPAEPGKVEEQDPRLHL